MKALLVAIVVALIASASASAATIQVGARLHHANHFAAPPVGRAGDADSSSWILRDRHGRTVGDMLLNCRWITGTVRLCIGQVGLPDGALVMLGASPTRFLGQMAVVGGTGRYIGAAGALTFNAIGSSRYVLLITFDQ